MQKAIMVDGIPRIVDEEEPKKDIDSKEREADVKIVKLSMNIAVANIFESASKSFGGDVAAEAFFQNVMEWIDMIKKAADKQ